MSETSKRCHSRCQVVPGVWKVCVREIDHSVDIGYAHLWVEALDRSDGDPEVFFWRDEYAYVPEIIYKMVSTL